MSAFEPTDWTPLSFETLINKEVSKYHKTTKVRLVATETKP